MKRRTRGFTLIELAIAVALATLLATLVVPSFAEQIAKHRVRAAAEALAGDLAETRFMAAQVGQLTQVSFAGSGGQACWAVTREAPCNCLATPGCGVKTTDLQRFKGVELVAATGAEFDPEGAASGGDAELRSSRGHRLRVMLRPSGRALICSPDGAEPRVPRC